MKKFTSPIFFILLSISLSGCGLMEDAFKAGVIITLIIVAVIAIVIWVLRLLWGLLNKYFPVVRVWYNERLGYED